MPSYVDWVLCLSCLQLEDASSWENAVDDVMLAFEKEFNRRAIYTICYY